MIGVWYSRKPPSHIRWRKLRTTSDRSVERVDANINDIEFGDRVLEVVGAMMGAPT